MARLVAAGYVFAIACLAFAGCNRAENRNTRLEVKVADDHPPRDAGPAVEPAVENATGPIVLRDVTAQTGITFAHTDGGSGRHYLVETVSSGLATFDYDGDGLVDIYFLNGSPLPGDDTQERPTNALYRNLGNFAFVDVTRAAGVGDTGYGLGVCVGDYDNDGAPDLFVNNFGPDVLYRNNGDGTFSDVTPPALLSRPETVGAGANFLDMDGDGDLDLFAANYVGFNFENHVTNLVRGAPWYAGPLDFPRQPNTLFRNEGDGAFSDVSEASGIAAHAGAGMGTICLDYDRDGDTDIFVANDQMWNFLFQNDGSGNFREVALPMGVASDHAGETVGSMGVDCADFDHNGWLDLFVTDFEQQKPLLFRNLGDGLFEDAILSSGAGAGAVAHVKWGVGFVDFDNDAFNDVFIGCGHLGEGFRESLSNTSSYLAPPVLLRNQAGEKFANVSHVSGDGMQVAMVARGVACDDLDNDGRVDVVVLNSRHGPTVLRNESIPAHHWFQVRLRGASTNRDGVGAQVKVIAGELEQIAEVHSGRSYQSHFGSILTFGLGERDHVDRIEVHWLGAGVDVVENLDANQQASIVEGAFPSKR
jgi:hypothetical protein